MIGKGKLVDELRSLLGAGPKAPRERQPSAEEWCLELKFGRLEFSFFFFFHKTVYSNLRINLLLKLN